MMVRQQTDPPRLGPFSGPSTLEIGMCGFNIQRAFARDGKACSACSLVKPEKPRPRRSRALTTSAEGPEQRGERIEVTVAVGIS